MFVGKRAKVPNNQAIMPDFGSAIQIVDRYRRIT
jgi:hypothetical protein